MVLAAAVGAGFSILTAPLPGAHAQSAAPGRALTVGALFTVTPNGGLGTHFCTASVVDSPSGDLVLTAAHCMTPHSAGKVAFVPDYSGGRMPDGVWMVSRVVVDQQWSASGDPDDDFAFLIVSQPGSKASVQQLTGGETIGIGAPAGRPVRAAGYPDGQNAVVICENTVLALSPTQFEFDCGGFTDGTSGGPFLDVSPSGGPSAVVGVIGGYQAGGYTASVSYAARFGPDMAALYKTAVADSSP